MFLISMRFGQGIGNQLWLLATGLYLSNKYKRKLVVKNMKWFLGEKIVSKELLSYISRWSSDFYKLDWVTFNDHFFQELSSNRVCHLTLTENTFELLSNFEYVYLDGNFQSFNLIPEADFLKKFFINSDYIFNREFKNNECILNIRGGDYLGVTKSPAVPFEYWYKMVNYFRNEKNVDKFFIVTDDYKYSKILFPNFQILKGSMEDDYFSILNAKNLILSNSSFSIFPSYLNTKAKNIIAPKYCDPILLGNKKIMWGSPTNIYPFMQYFDWHRNQVESYDEKYKNTISLDTLDKIIPVKKIGYFLNENKLVELLKPVEERDIYKKHPGLKYIDSYRVKWRDLILLFWKIRRIIFLIIFKSIKVRKNFKFNVKISEKKL